MPNQARRWLPTRTRDAASRQASAGSSPAPATARTAARYEHELVGRDHRVSCGPAPSRFRAAQGPGTGRRCRGPRRAPWTAPRDRRDRSMVRTMSSPTWRISAGPKPRVVTAGDPDPDARGRVGWQRIERDGVLVDRDAHLVQEPLGLLAGDTRAASRRPASGGCPCRPRRASRPARRGSRRAPGRSRWSAAGPPGMARLQGQLEGHRLGGDDVHQRSALDAREHRLVDCRPEVRAGERMPPRGPRSVLWVVVVTRSACGNGLGCSPAATSPAMCAMSTNRTASTPWAIAAMRSKSMMRG